VSPPTLTHPAHPGRAVAFINSLVDPHIGGDHGFAEWTRIVGNTTMLVLPGTRATRLEAWRPLLEDCGFEGSMAEWTVLSGAWAAEWGANRQAPVLSMPSDLAGTGVWGPDPSSPWPSWWRGEVVHVPGTASAQWLPPSVLELRAGESASFALRFTLAPAGPRSRDAALADAGEPVLSAVPGYTLGTDMDPQSTFLLVSPPAGQAVAGVTADPPSVCPLGAPVPVPGSPPPGWWRVPITPAAVGRCRAYVNFTGGTASVAHLRVLPPFRAQVAALGAHWANTSWLPREYPDPFGRSAAVLPWDREDGVHVLDDSRAYIVGLSDDAGAGNHLGFATKVAWAPVQVRGVGLATGRGLFVCAEPKRAYAYAERPTHASTLPARFSRLRSLRCRAWTSTSPTRSTASSRTSPSRRCGRCRAGPRTAPSSRTRSA
jgi:hypothetical protein